MIKNSTTTIFGVLLVSATILMANTYITETKTEIAEKENVVATEETEPTANKEPFDIMMQVLTHKRCLNCHPSGNQPLQGEDSQLHNFHIQRGEDGHGMVSAQCSTCHQAENNDYSGVPGAPHWHLAPSSMAWEGLSRVQIAQSMLDEEKNGGRTIEEIEKHLTEDGLVMWAFEPGVNNEGEAREKPPVSKKDFIKAVKQWVADGAEIPDK